MKTIIYTAPESVRNETGMISEMLACGADFLYLRRKDADTHYWMAFLEQIPIEYYPRIFTTDFRVLHEMELGGFHFRDDVLKNIEEKDLRENLSMLRNKVILSSRTVRNLAELQENDGKFDLLLAAPIFESISKPGHTSNWDLAALKMFLSDKNRQSTVVALGGVEPEKLDMLHLLEFDGVAVLGTLWKQPQQAVHVFKNILSKCR
jgi:thiamine-phosphate pyrophosphorylase